jgi:hypothetical protein
MVEKYKREGIDIVLDSRKCIYANDKNEKFIKQNKEYIPIVKKKGKYVIIDKKGGAPKSIGERIYAWKSAGIDKERERDKERKIERDKEIEIKRKIEREKEIEIERKIVREKEIEREKIPEKLKESIQPHSFNEEIDEKTKLESDIVKHIKNTELLRKDIIKNMTIPMTITTTTLHNKKIELQSMREKSEKLKQEAWNKKSPNPEKEQFLKEITEKEELIKSLQENHTQYINKMIREDIYLDNYLKEKNNDIDLDFMYEENHPFLVEHLLKRIIDLEKRIDMTHN